MVMMYVVGVKIVAADEKMQHLIEEMALVAPCQLDKLAACRVVHVYLYLIYSMMFAAVAVVESQLAALKKCLEFAVELLCVSREFINYNILIKKYLYMYYIHSYSHY